MMKRFYSWYIHIYARLQGEICFWVIIFVVSFDVSCTGSVVVWIVVASVYPFLLPFYSSHASPHEMALLSGAIHPYQSYDAPKLASLIMPLKGINDRHKGNRKQKGVNKRECKATLRYSLGFFLGGFFFCTPPNHHQFSYGVPSPFPVSAYTQ